jgi:microcystin-dependent protein
MSRIAQWRDDITGTTVTTGTGTAYALASNQVFLSNGNGYTIQFTPGATNTGAVTLSVDSQTAAPLRFLTGVDLPSGVLISGSLYQATYRAASGEWLLHASPLAAPFLIPLGGLIDYIGLTSPSANFILPQGQAISRTTYAALFSLVGTAFGGGDGSTTFNVIDLVGRVAAMRDVGSARLSATYFGSNPAILGNSGGSESQPLAATQIPSITSAGTNSISVTATRRVVTTGTSFIQDFPSTVGSGLRAPDNTSLSEFGTSTGNNSISVTSNNTSGAAHNNVQPTAIVQKLLRVL